MASNIDGTWKTTKVPQLSFDESSNARVTTWAVTGKSGDTRVNKPVDSLNENTNENTVMMAQSSDCVQSSWTMSKKLSYESQVPRSFNCPHRGCIAGFETIKKLKRHKEDEHDFCKLHNLDFENFEALLAHKVESSEHITCPICGMDFQSLSGRERHITVVRHTHCQVPINSLTKVQMHPKVQKCECPGCENVYSRAAALMHHIENNLCSSITWAQYMKVYLKNSLLAGHIENLDTGVVVLGPEATPLDLKDKSEFPHLKFRPESLNRDDACQREQGSLYRTQAMEHLSDRTRQTSQRNSKELSAGHLVNCFDQEGSEGFHEELAPKNDNYKQLSKHNYRDAYLIDGDIKEEIKIKPLMPLADLPADKGTRMKRLGRMMWGDNAIEKLNDIISPKDVPSHLNPFSDSFDIEAFRLLDKYRCPNPTCLKRFDKGRDLAVHMQSPAHYNWECRCPQCFSVFKGAAALVSHMEAPSFKCRIKESKYFKDALEVATSGFLYHERCGNDHIFMGKEPVFE